MLCYHTTTRERLPSILVHGLQPGSPPTWFRSPAPYVMLSDRPWWDLNGRESVVLEVDEPAIRPEYFSDPEGLRWPHPVPPERLKVISRPLHSHA